MWSHLNGQVARRFLHTRARTSSTSPFRQLGIAGAGTGAIIASYVAWKAASTSQKITLDSHESPEIPPRLEQVLAESSSSLPSRISPKPMREQVEQYIRTLQEDIVASLEQLDPDAPAFRRDAWTRSQGGYGQSCVFAVPATDNSSTPTPDTILEKAGVNISIVHGKLPPAAIKQMRADHGSLPENITGGLPFFAAGLSLVIHPRNPHAPTVHCNYRYFEISNPDKPNEVLTWWFGGGADLTPSYLYEEDAIHFHQTLKDACQTHSKSLYSPMKKWCDEYFYIPHRGESRGVGGIFFDDLSNDTHKRITSDERPKSADELFSLMQTLGNAFVPSYVPILQKRYQTPWTERERRWQLLRRGRYVEFNLVYDRGTKFGLTTPNARIESILMSLPEVARWEYMSELGEDPETEEGKLMDTVKNPRDWVKLD